jgi:hypothetical protein
MNVENGDEWVKHSHQHGDHSEEAAECASDSVLFPKKPISLNKTRTICHRHTNAGESLAIRLELTAPDAIQAEVNRRCRGISGADMFIHLRGKGFQQLKYSTATPH